LIKPYNVTRETRYLGLPLGFGFLGASYLLSALAHATPTFSINTLAWFQLLARPFAFLFLAFTYFFSKKSSKNQLWWDATLSVLIVILTSAFMLLLFAPQSSISNYRILSIYARAFDLASLSYIIVHTLRSHLETQNSKIILTPVGYIFLAIGQYSILIWTIDSYFNSSSFAFYAGLVLRWIGLVLFLVIAYRTFYGSKRIQ